MLQDRKLGPVSLAALLLSTHYGMGFLLGTAEQAFTQGLAGSLYAVSLGLGTFGLMLIARFYWTRVDQIWTLLGDRYGQQTRVTIGVMSWVSMIGIGAAQIISGTFILKVLGLPVLPSMVGLTLLIMLLSLLPMEKASWIYRSLLAVNFLALVYALSALHGLGDYGRSPLEFLPALEHMKPAQTLGIFLSTVLLIQVDMNCQQFLVQAKNLRSLYWGCILAALMLLALAMVPSVLVNTAQSAGILPPGLDGKETIPYILTWLGGGVGRPVGMALVAALLVPALGTGSSVLRIQTKTTLDFWPLLPNEQANRWLWAGLNGLICLAIALKASSIITLIVCFYAVYVAAVCVPFVAFLLDQVGYTFSASSLRLGLFMGSATALAILVLSLVTPQWLAFGSPELNIMIFGLGAGFLGLLGSQLVEMVFSTPTQAKEEI
ncbi:MAG: hypothetical protein VKJ64_02780 [Leptolyngbyaceae bacterium]|nr:hypothetical protein [Leptolyngbyaceae bacterium]